MSKKEKMREQEYVIKRKYSLWGWEFDSKPSAFEIGFYWFLAVILFPIWIWCYLFYQFLSFIGHSLNGVKYRDVKEKREKEEYGYY